MIYVPTDSQRVVLILLFHTIYVTPIFFSLKEQDDLKIQDLPPPDTVEDFEPLSDDIFTAPVSLTKG